MRLSHLTPEQFLLEEQLAAIERYERVLAESGRVPAAERSLHRHALSALQWAGGLVIAANVAVVAMLVNFILFNMMLHTAF